MPAKEIPLSFAILLQLCLVSSGLELTLEATSWETTIKISTGFY